MEMAMYIMSILRSQFIVVLSWGFHSAYVIEDGLEFSVEGYLFTGDVQVTYDEGTDTFKVRLLNGDGTIKEEHSDVYVDNLVDVIDRAVEKNESQEEYKERVEATYHI